MVAWGKKMGVELEVQSSNSKYEVQYKGTTSDDPSIAGM